MHVQRRWSLMLQAPPPARLGDANSAFWSPRIWYDLVQSAKARGESYTEQDFDYVFPVVQKQVIKAIEIEAWQEKVPLSAAGDISHIVIAWMWQRLANLKAAFDTESSTPFIYSAITWFSLYGKKLEPGKPSLIRWDAVPWSRGLQRTNLAALDWNKINAVCQNLPADMRLGGYVEPNPPQNISWPNVDWYESDIPGATNLLWSSVPWTGIPWGDVNWSVINRLPNVFWKELGPLPTVVEYKGPIASLQGRLVSPTALVIARLAEIYPDSVDASKIPSSEKPEGWTPVWGQPYINKKIFAPVFGKTKPKDEIVIVEDDSPPGGRPPTSDKDESKGTSVTDVDQAPPAAPAPAPQESGFVTALKWGVPLAAAAVVLSSLTKPPRRRRLARRLPP